MNREIKFRGLTMHGNVVYGNLSILTRRYEGAPVGIYIANSAGSPFAFSIRPETVMQFTGLKDKNGKEIYEGDIIKYRSHPAATCIAQVIFDDKSARFMAKSDSHSWYSFQSYNLIEVIGNIYENPELLPPSDTK